MGGHSPFAMNVNTPYNTQKSDKVVPDPNAVYLDIRSETFPNIYSNSKKESKTMSKIKDIFLKIKSKLPDRKVLAGGFVGILTWVATDLVGISDPDISAAIAGSVMTLVYALTPDSVDDIIRKYDNKIKSMAGDSKPISKSDS